MTVSVVIATPASVRGFAVLRILYAKRGFSISNIACSFMADMFKISEYTVHALI